MDAPANWQVSFIRWDHFKSIMVERETNPTWGVVWEATDLIVGGLNFEGDFL